MSNKIIHQQILEKVNKLGYSSTSNNELLSFATEACSSILSQDAIETKAKFKDQFKNIRDKEIRPLLDDELLMEEKKVMFTNAKEKFATLLKEYLTTP